MKFVRKLVWLEAKYSFVIRARHIPGVSNSISDSLSRFNFQKFRSLAPVFTDFFNYDRSLFQFWRTTNVTRKYFIS